MSTSPMPPRLLMRLLLFTITAINLPCSQSIILRSLYLSNHPNLSMDFPSLEHLQVNRLDIELLQRHGETMRFPNLSKLTLAELSNLKALPSIYSKTLRCLDFFGAQYFMEFSSKQLPTYPHYMPFIMSCELEELKLSNMNSLEELIDEEKSVDNRSEFDVALVFSLRKLELRHLPKLKRIPWCMLTNLRSLIINRLKSLTCLISTNLLVVGGGVLPLLETIEISDCENLEAIISRENKDLVKYGITLFPSLRHIRLKWLYKLERFSMGNYEEHFPSLETVEIITCYRLQSFSSGSIRTPRLKHVKVDWETLEADAIDDLNTVMAEIVERMKGNAAK